MAPAQIQRVGSAQGDVDSQFIAIGSRVHAIRSRAPRRRPRRKRVGGDDPKISESIVSVHHDAPRYVLAKLHKRRRIVAAPFKNPTDAELTLIESLVGRNPPFSLFDNPTVVRGGIDPFLRLLPEGPESLATSSHFPVSKPSAIISRLAGAFCRVQRPVGRLDDASSQFQRCIGGDKRHQKGAPHQPEIMSTLHALSIRVNAKAGGA